MPNWCENKLTIIGSTEEIKQIRKSLFSENPQTHEVILDFNCLIEMPKAVQIDCGSSGDRAVSLLRKPKDAPLDDEAIEKLIFNKTKALSLSLRARQNAWTFGDFIYWLNEDINRQEDLGFDLQLGQLYEENQIKYNAVHWYDWALSNWGCKWNADTQYVDEDDDGILCDFDTPWGPPENWFISLCKAHPNLSLKLDYYEPGCNFAGSIESNNGSINHHEFTDDNEMRKFTLDVFGYCFTEDGLETE